MYSILLSFQTAVPIILIAFLCPAERDDNRGGAGP